MLSFATEFPVKETSREGFVEAVKTWILGSPHTKFSTDQIATIPDTGRWQVETPSSRLEALLIKTPSGENAGFRHVAFDRDLEWVTEVVYSKNDSDDWIGVRTSRESAYPQPNLPAAKKPVIVRTLIERLGGGLDDELFIKDSPHVLSDKDSNMAVRLLNADADNYLPLVYISCHFSGRLLVDPLPLARSLSGLAHVLVEPSRDFSRSIQADVGSQNVYGGAVGVYWPNGDHYRYIAGRFETEFELRRAVEAHIRQSLLNRRPLARCTWARVEAEAARSVFEALKSAGSSDVEDYVSAFDSEMAAKDRQLEDAENEVARLNARLRSKNFRDEEVEFGLSFGSEQQFFDGEFKEILRDSLLQAANNAQDGGRRQHVLRAAANDIPDTSALKDLRESVKELLKGYTSMTGDLQNELARMGFSLTEDGKHNKLVYMNDDRYTFTIPKSGSDWRGGMNSASDIGKRVF